MRSGSTQPQVVGKGWSSVLTTAMPPMSNGASGSSTSLGTLGAVMKSLPTVSGPWGSGHLLSGTLFSALVTDDGRVAVGAVPPAQLYQALAAQ
jgi:hypothetical protein